MVLIIVHHFYRIFRRCTLGSRWPLKLHNKVPLYSCIFSIIFCETSRTTGYILTAEQRRAWSWESVSRLKKAGEKICQFQSSKSRKFAKFITSIQCLQTSRTYFCYAVCQFVFHKCYSKQCFIFIRECNANDTYCYHKIHSKEYNIIVIISNST